MKAQDLYEKLEKDFIAADMIDEWAIYMDDVVDYLSENFRARSMGLVCDFAQEINKVYTAVFPSQSVMQKIIDDDVHDVLLFVHHPSIWDIRKDPAFYKMDTMQLQKFKERRIAIYNLHVPLDHFSDFSTSVTFARTLQIEPTDQFALYYGAMAGVIGRTHKKSIADIRSDLERAVGHTIAVYAYGSDIITTSIAIVAGGGLDKAIIQEAYEKSAHVFVTGITAYSDYTKDAHVFAQENKITILGATHYSTEKFACQAMCKYFLTEGLPSEFIVNEPVLEDL